MLMVAVMAIAAAVAEQINLPPMVGAFLAGLAVNGAVQDNPARTKLEVFRTALFIPSFFIATGLVIDSPAFAAAVVRHFPLAAAIVAALLAGKWIAAAIAARGFGYAGAARSKMWALTLPQVAATWPRRWVHTTHATRRRADAERHGTERRPRVDAGHIHPWTGADRAVRTVDARAARRVQAA